MDCWAYPIKENSNLNGSFCIHIRDVDRLGIELFVNSAIRCAETVSSELGRANAEGKNSLVMRANVWFKTNRVESKGCHLN